MKKSVVLISILIISVFLTGCGNTQTSQNTTSTGNAFVGGSDGLAISFVENAPPKEVYAKDVGATEPNKFSISVKVENKGEFTVPAKNYKLSLTGIDFVAFGKTSTDVNKKDKDEVLEKTRRSVGEVIPGSYAFFDFNDLGYTTSVSGQVGPFNLRAAVCYPYETEVSAKACILQDLYGRSGRTPLCKANEDKSVENSGAPVQVTNLKQSITGNNQITLTFNVKQVGDSKDVVFASDTNLNCDLTNLNSQNKVSVNVIVGTIAATNIDCAGLSAGKATLYGDKGAEIRCNVKLTTPVDQEVPVKIKLGYDYYEYADTPITVKQLGS